MTHPALIVDLAAMRGQYLDGAAVQQGYYEAAAAQAAEHADAVLQYLEQAQGLSALLREVDSEHAEEYPDSELPAGPVPEPPVATGLRALADLFAKHPELAEHCRPRILCFPQGATGGERIRNVEDGADLIGADLEWRGDHYMAQLTFPGGVEFAVIETEGIRDAAHLARVRPAWLPEPEPFVQATPAEVAAAYESSAAYAQDVRDHDEHGVHVAYLGGPSRAVAEDDEPAPVPLTRAELDMVELGERAADALSAAEAVHMMPFTPSGRDSGHALCGSPEGPVATNDEDVTCGDCLKQQNRQYTAARGRKAVAR